jgi:hypothetical protein
MWSTHKANKIIRDLLYHSVQIVKIFRRTQLDSVGDTQYCHEKNITIT